MARLPLADVSAFPLTEMLLLMGWPLVQPFAAVAEVPPAGHIHERFTVAAARLSNAVAATGLPFSYWFPFIFC
jgi:hypothetical protein